jgi:hypothetical protein
VLSDPLFCDLVGPVEEIFFADIDEEVGEELGLCKSLTCGYAFGDLPPWIFFEPHLILGTSRR